MASVGSLFNGFFLLLLHLGCFFSSSNPNPNTDPTVDEHTPTPKRRKISPVSSSPASSDSALNNTRNHSSLSLSLSLSIRFRSHVNRLFSFRNKTHKDPPAQPISPPSPPHPSLPLSPDNDAIDGSISSEPATKRGSFSARTEIFPCPACGEVLTKAHLLDLHQATNHALSDLRDGDSGRNIVAIIFHSGWIGFGGNPPVIRRILKIHHSPRTLARFEEYREDVRSRGRGRGEDERCIADGNERLRFYCSTVMCALGRDGPGPGPPGACGAQFCSTCAIVRHGFSGKQAELGGIATHGTSWDAHVSLPEDLEREFAFLQVRRAMLVCRVIAGRVGVARCGAAEENGTVWDSVIPLRRGGGPRSSWAEDEELLVFRPRAVLPCFIIVYNS